MYTATHENPFKMITFTSLPAYRKLDAVLDILLEVTTLEALCSANGFDPREVQSWLALFLNSTNRFEPTAIRHYNRA